MVVKNNKMNVKFVIKRLHSLEWDLGIENVALLFWLSANNCDIYRHLDC